MSPSPARRIETALFQAEQARARGDFAAEWDAIERARLLVETADAEHHHEVLAQLNKYLTSEAERKTA